MVFTVWRSDGGPFMRKMVTGEMLPVQVMLKGVRAWMSYSVLVNSTALAAATKANDLKIVVERILKKGVLLELTC